MKTLTLNRRVRGTAKTRPVQPKETRKRGNWSLRDKYEVVKLLLGLTCGIGLGFIYGFCYCLNALVFNVENPVLKTLWPF